MILLLTLDKIDRNTQPFISYNYYIPILIKLKLPTKVNLMKPNQTKYRETWNMLYVHFNVKFNQFIFKGTPIMCTTEQGVDNKSTIRLYIH